MHTVPWVVFGTLAVLLTCVADVRTVRKRMKRVTTELAAQVSLNHGLGRDLAAERRQAMNYQAMLANASMELAAERARVEELRRQLAGS